jgi:hypothetical protein
MDAFFRTLPGLIEAMDNSEEVRDAFIFAAWRRIAGEQITERTEPLAVTENKLVIAVEDRSWQRNLETLAAQLLFKLNATLKNVSIVGIEFRIDDAVLLKRNTAKANDEITPFILPEEIAVSVRSIADEKLRNTVSRAAENCLARN